MLTNEVRYSLTTLFSEINGIMEINLQNLLKIYLSC